MVFDILRPLHLTSRSCKRGRVLAGHYCYPPKVQVEASTDVLSVIPSFISIGETTCHPADDHKNTFVFAVIFCIEDALAAICW